MDNQRNSITRENITSITESLQTSKIIKTSLGNIILDLSSDVIVPHPSDLDMIEIAHDIISKETSINTIADVGTGCGILAIGLAKVLIDKIIYATDISEQILNIAKKNSELNKISNIHFLINLDGKWLSEFGNEKVDFIISNPPFTSDSEFTSADYRKRFPMVKFQAEKALRTYDQEGVKPYVDIIKESTKLFTKRFLFRVNPNNISSITSALESLSCRVEVLEVKGTKRFLKVTRE